MALPWVGEQLNHPDLKNLKLEEDLVLALPLGNQAVLSRPSLKNFHDLGGEPGLASEEGLGLGFIIFSH